MKKKFSFSFWGAVMVLAAVALLLDGLGVAIGGFGPVRIVGGILLVAWVIYELARVRITKVFFPLAFLFLLFEQPLAAALGRGDDLISNWTVLLAALLLTVGFKAILRKMRRKSYFTKIGNFKRIGESTLYIDANDLDSCHITENLGRVQVYVTNQEQYRGDGVITVTENLGDVTLHLPAHWQVVTQASENLGKVDIPPQSDAAGPCITLRVSENIGRIKVVFD